MISDFICTNSALTPGIYSNPSTGLQTFKCFDENGEPQVGIVQMRSVTVSATATTTPEAAFSDGMTLGWGVVAAMVAAYAMTLLRRAL